MRSNPEPADGGSAAAGRVAGGSYVLRSAQAFRRARRGGRQLAPEAREVRALVAMDQPVETCPRGARELRLRKRVSGPSDSSNPEEKDESQTVTRRSVFVREANLAVGLQD